MIECRSDFAPIRCPYCGAMLDVEDPDDLETGKPMHREEDIRMTCPVCDGEMIVDIRWRPMCGGVKRLGGQA